MENGSTQRSSAYDHFHPGVQQWIRRQRWEELRTVQEEAAVPILQEDRDVIISAATAGGKTEAAFLPIASRVAEEWEDNDLGGLSVLYVSPLKALINDQYRRLQDLFEPLHIPVFRWHGDVASSRKRKAREQGGVLLITPESLEAQLIRNGHRMKSFLSPLRYAVVDELHAFIGTERGRQLQSLLYRVKLAARTSVPRIALSATIGDMEKAAEFLRPGDGSRVVQINDDSEKQTVQLQIRGYEHKAVDPNPDKESPEEASGDLVDITKHLYETLRGGRHIVFANSRSNVETTADILRRRCEKQGVPNEFLAHHGSLGRNLRDDAERRLRDAARPTTVVATTTLELGIDVGEVESIAQVGPPPSVASMRQRLGRSGRRGDPAVLRIYIREPELTSKSSPLDRLRIQLVRSIAMVLLLAERWYEPPITGALHLSTLVQQILSLIAQHGGLDAQQGYNVLCQRGPFRSVDVSQFTNILRDLGTANLITQTHDGTLVLDLKGEQVVNHYDFYAAFSTPEEYRLVANGKQLGSLPIVIPLYEGAYLIFGGQRWQVTRVDEKKKIVELVPAKGGKPPIFGGVGALVHHRVRQKMLEVYTSEEYPRFIDPTGRELLEEARYSFAEMDLRKTPFWRDGENTFWFPWSGDRKMFVLELALRKKGMNVEKRGPMLSVENTSPQKIKRIAHELQENGAGNLHQLAALVQNKEVEKHHIYLRDDLLAADYASKYLDSMFTAQFSTK